jgi:uncharacterized protein
MDRNQNLAPMLLGQSSQQRSELSNIPKVLNFAPISSGLTGEQAMFRILCLDGGGIKGVFTAAALARIEDQTKRKIVDYFDLISGTSTGGILAIGLGMGLSAAELLNFYQTRGPAIFPVTSMIERSTGFLRQFFFGPKLSHNVLKQELSAVLKDRKFGEAKCRLAIPSYDAVAGRIYVFKTAHDPRLLNDIHTPAVDVALATSAAPM